MPPAMPASVPRMRKALLAVISAHAAVREGIATHAEKHEAEIDAKRRKLEENQAITNGIANANRPVQGH